MNSFKEYYNLKEGWRDYMPTVAGAVDAVADPAKDFYYKKWAEKHNKKAGLPPGDPAGFTAAATARANDAATWDATKGEMKQGAAATWKGAKKAERMLNPYAKGNVIGKAADWMDRTTKRMQGDVGTVDSKQIAAFRQKLGKIYTAPKNAATDPLTGTPSNKITLDVKDILNANLPSPTPTGRKPDGTDIYSPAFTTYQQAIAAAPPQLFDYVNFTATRRGIYKDAHHFANIVLDEMSKFLAGGKYSYKDAAAILYGHPGSKTGKFDPDAIAILDKYGMLYKE